MSVNATSLSAPIDRNQLDIPVASTAGASAGRMCKIENEYSVVVRVVGSIVSLRSRGDQGTSAQPHDILAPVVFADATDFPTIPPARNRGQQEEVDYYTTYGASGVIAIPDKDAHITLAGGAVQNMTLADPSRLQDGTTLTIVSAGAFAHTVTAPAGFNAGGAAFDVGTFAGAVGNNLVVRAVQGKWVVLSSVGVTLA
jgi:hypothetical protein